MRGDGAPLGSSRALGILSLGVGIETTHEFGVTGEVGHHALRDSVARADDVDRIGSGGDGETDEDRLAQLLLASQGATEEPVVDVRAPGDLTDGDDRPDAVPAEEGGKAHAARWARPARACDGGSVGGLGLRLVGATEGDREDESEHIQKRALGRRPVRALRQRLCEIRPHLRHRFDHTGLAVLGDVDGL